MDYEIATVLQNMFTRCPFKNFILIKSFPMINEFFEK